MLGDNDGKGNGHKGEQYSSALDLLEGIQRQDGILSDAASKARQREGVIMTTITAIMDDKDYRQILKRGNYRSTEEMDLYANALNCCLYVGAVQAFRALLDRITIHSAGVNFEGVRMALESLTHTTQVTRESFNQRKFKDQGENIRKETGIA